MEAWYYLPGEREENVVNLIFEFGNRTLTGNHKVASLCRSVADFFKDRGLKSPHNLVNKTIGLETVPQAMSKQI